MNFDLEKIVEKIAEDNELSQEFSRLDEMDDIYNYCKDMGLDCDEKEFDDGISEYINVLNEDIYQDEIFEEKLSNIGGGVNLKNVFSKSVASVLSALAMGGSMELSTVDAADSLSIANNSKTSVSFSEKVSKKWSNTKEALYKFYQNHKKSIKWIAAATVGVLILAGAANCMGKMNNFEALCDKWYKDPNEENLKAIKKFVDERKDQNLKIKYEKLLEQDKVLKEVMENPKIEKCEAMAKDTKYNVALRARAKAMGDIIKAKNSKPGRIMGLLTDNKDGKRKAYKEAEKSVKEAEQWGVTGLREPLSELQKYLGI